MQRAEEFGWNQGAGNIVFVNGINSIKHYGRLTTEQLRNAATPYMDNASRQTQNNDQMYRVIMNNLTESCAAEVINRPSEYTIEILGQKFRSATLLHKALMQRAIVDTRATASNFRTNLSSLDKYMPLVDSNIKKFNLYVTENIRGLEARGETSQDLLDNLFKGYKVASDEKFVKYIEDKETDYFDGENLTPDGLMKLAENKYATRKQRGLWGGKTEEQKQIIALTSTVTSLQNSIKSRKVSNKFDKRNKNKNKSDKDKDKKEKSNKKKKNDEKWAWKLVPPKDNGEKNKKFDGKIYHWYPKHNTWTLHTPQECNKNDRGTDESKDKDNNSNNVSFASSVSQIMENLEDEE